MPIRQCRIHSHSKTTKSHHHPQHHHQHVLLQLRFPLLHQCPAPQPHKQQLRPGHRSRLTWMLVATASDSFLATIFVWQWGNGGVLKERRTLCNSTWGSASASSKNPNCSRVTDQEGKALLNLYSSPNQEEPSTAQRTSFKAVLWRC